MPSNPSFNWSKLQNVYYNIRTCYDELNWTIDNLYSNYLVSLSPNATLIAIASKSAPHPNLIEIYSISGHKLWSVVYNSTHNDYIQSFHFTRDEDLIIVLNNGKYRHYYDLIGNFNEYNFVENLVTMDNISQTPNGADKIDPNSDNTRIITNLENNQTEEIVKIMEVKTWNKFLVVRLESKLIVTDLDSFTNYAVSLASYAASDFECFNIQGKTGTKKAVTIQLGYRKSILSIDVDFDLASYEIVDQELTDGPFSSIAISPSGQLISLFNKQLKKIFVISNKFDQILLDYDTSNESSDPYQVQWCGNDAIVLSFKDEIKLIGPGQQSISFFYDIEDDDEFDLDNLMVKKDNKSSDYKKFDDLLFTIPILQTSIDGLRIITTTKVQFLSRVPETCVQMYQVGSTAPSSILADCVDKFSANASKADSNISLLRADNTLLKAMEDCLQVALEEFSPDWQRRALKAVSFGKVYYDDYFDSDKFVSVVDNIKVLNLIRSPELGLFLTYQQIENIGGWEEVIKMLLRRNHHDLSLDIIKKLNLGNAKPLVYIHWCCYKIRKELDMSDIDLFKLITDKLISSTKKARVNYISTDQISETAHEEGREELCKLLLHLEPSVIKKIGKLLDLDEDELALLKSFQNGNYDLSTLILLYLQDNLTTSQFFKVLSQTESVSKKENSTKQAIEKLDIEFKSEYIQVTGDVVGHAWEESIAKDSSPRLLETYLKHEDRIYELNVFKIQQFKHDSDVHRDNYYESYKSVLTKCINRSTNQRISKALQREIQILELQKKLSDTYLADFYQDKALMGILKRLIVMNQIKPAKKIAANFQLSVEKFWYLVLNTLMDRCEFDQLYEFAFGSSDQTSGNSPIGFEPFAELGLRKNAPQSHISTYIRNSTKYKYEERISMFIKNDDYESAALEAFRNKDIEILKSLLQKIPNSNQAGTQVVNSYIQQLGY
ncbi:unnamed protein product [Candida dubliniensis CD36]|uniref:Probable vacuolar protein sorting-associated protein 16 homolog n=1 Tax=Candida dubliniensis (strain CD36 / ATCC MYA-646 / CBS 7987 / NCPF 3949 / NRRL Y-17841) TaxID=573826 RepID=B9W7M7_CANDC|nr:uncharacterized protein CD36_04280 [Candida dubliniensis CD36]CAX44688.1 unnamed protein product [Candida dubliniensis CD36]